MPETFWKELAKQEIKAGYIPGSWQGLLDRSLQESRPELVKELGEDYQSYLIVQVAAARQAQQDLLEQGTNPQTARELAMRELLNPGE